MEKERKEKEALVTARVLFYSVLDKIFVVWYAICFVTGLFGGILGKQKTVGGVLGYYVGFIASFAVLALIFNWFYKCATKTMLCITEDEFYKEGYAPLKRSETSIPLNKVTSVTTFNFFWIFRSIIIFQYHQLPVVFFTWKNQELKDKFDELVDNRKVNIKNEFDDKTMISFINKKFYPIIGAVVAGLVVVFAIIAMVLSLVDPSSKVVGVYEDGDNTIRLNKDASCDLSIGSYKVTACSWSYDKDLEEVAIKYTYEVTSSYSNRKNTYDGSLKFNYSKNELTNTSYTYTKRK